MTRVAVLGGAGVVGGWAARHLARDTDDIVTVDRTGDIDHRCDVRSPDTGTRAAVAMADVVVLALPKDVVADCLGWLPAAASPSAVVVSTCSVQRPVFERAAGVGMRQVLLGVNPMFSPTLPSTGRPVLLVAQHRCDDAARVRDRLTAAGTRVTVMTPEEHDRATSYLQVLPHAVVLGFVGALAQAPVDVAALLRIAPPPFRTLVALACRMITAPAEVYWDVQHANPEGGRRRQDLSDALARLDGLVTAGDPEDFHAALAGAADRLDSCLIAGADDCRILFHALPEKT